MTEILCPNESETLNQTVESMLQDAIYRNGLSQEALEKAKNLPTLEAGLAELLKATSRGGRAGAIASSVQSAWEDAVAFCLATITAPQDNISRTVAPWARSCSDVCKELLSLYGESTVAAAQRGCNAIPINHFDGNPHKIPHVDKRMSFLRHWRSHNIGVEFQPVESVLATGAYESGSVPCAMALLAWATPEQAAKLAAISHVPICDDFSVFTGGDREARIRSVALALGAANEFGGWAAEAIVDGSLLQSLGTGPRPNVNPIDSIMAWRAVGGCSSPYTSYLFGIGTLEEAVEAPLILVATHDLFDWRSDLAAGNYQNGISGVYGLRLDDPHADEKDSFHVYLETILEKAVANPAVLHSVAAMTLTHFTAARYGGYEYHGTHQDGCDNCQRLLRNATEDGGLKWTPEVPPRNFAEGVSVRLAARKLIDEHVDVGLSQIGLSWFQHLVTSGAIWLFDVFQDGAKAVDQDADWA